MTATTYSPAFGNMQGFSPLRSLKLRNQTLDAFFYDVGNLSAKEIDAAAGWQSTEGQIVVVDHTKDSGLTFFETADQFLQMNDRPRHLAVAGVGSSAVGTAAFARNIAKALDAPVAAVVSGYGMKDLLSEAMGGWFWFRSLNRLRREAEDLLTSKGGQDQPFGGVVTPGREAQTLRTLFTQPKPAFDTIVGHSKGNLSISEGLYQALDDAPTHAKKLLKDALIITMSAAIYMPKEAKRVVDVMGRIDTFGLLNSQPGLDIDVPVDRAWHHTNRTMPFALDVADAIQEAVEFDARRT